MAQDGQYKTKKTIGAEKRGQFSYNEMAKSGKEMTVVAAPFKVIDAAGATAGALVGKGNLCRVFGVAASLVRFGASNPAGIPIATDQDSIQLGSTVEIIVAADEFIRTTADVTRIEVVED